MVATRARKRQLTSAVTVAVFDTAELLEEILLAMPIEDLLRAQAVSSTWKAAMNNSVRIQRALFFRPISLDDGSHQDSAESSTGPAATGGSKPATLFNPLLLICKDHLAKFRCVSWSFEASDSSWKDLKTHSPSFSRMLLAQPALTSVRVFGTIHRKEGTTVAACRERTVTNPNGLRMQEVYGSLLELASMTTTSTDRVSLHVMPIKGDERVRWARLEDNKQLEELRGALKGR